MTVFYKSNGAKVGDGMRITRVSGGGAVFEVWTGAAWSEVEAKPDAAPVPTPAPVPDPVPTPVPDPAPTPTPMPVPDPAPTPVPTPTPTPIPMPPIPASIPASAVMVTAATLASAIMSGASDVVFPAGYHGSLTLSGIKLANPVSIWCSPGALFERVRMVGGTRNIRLLYPSAWPDQVAPVKDRAVIFADASTDNIEVYRADVRGHVSAENYGQWTLAEWAARKTLGVQLAGTNSKIIECRSLGVQMAFNIGGAGSSIINCLGLGISEDGFRVVGDGDVFLVAGVYVGDFVTTDGTHPDGGQAWSRMVGGAVGSGMLNNLTVKGVRVVELIEAAGVMTGLPQSCTFRAKPQGIGFHDGSYSNLKILDNRIWTSTGWGIHAYLRNGSGALIAGNECYDTLKRPNYAFIGVPGAGVVDGGNIAGRQTYGTSQTLVKPIDYSTAPAPEAPPAWVQWS